MDPADNTSKPKRRLTVTDKFREAHRESLARAREKARLALRGYRRGPQEDDVAYNARLARQITPWRTSLRRAVAAKKADRSAHYASHFTHGVTAPDLDRSAAAAGENREELRRHIERCQRAIGALIDDCRLSIDDCRLAASVDSLESQEVDGQKSKVEDSNRPPSIGNRQSKIVNPVDRQSKIILALAYVLWRTLRLLRTQVRWERWALAFRLQELAGWRERNPELTAERLNRFRHDLDLVTRDVTSAWPRLRKLRQRFEALWTALFDPERWERLAQHILEPSKFPNEPMFMAPSPDLIDLLRASAGGPRRRRARHEESEFGESEAGPSEVAQLGVSESGVLGSSFGAGPLRPSPESRAPSPALRSPFNLHFDPIAYLCRTHSHGAQDWRLRLDELRAETLGDPFQSSANVEGALHRHAAAAEVAEGRKACNRRQGDSGSDSKHKHRAQDPTARIPDDKLLEPLAAIGMLADLNSLSEVRELLAQGLGDCRLTMGDCRSAPLAGSPESEEVESRRSEIEDLAEALWTRIEGMQVLVETLEGFLVRLLEYHGSFRVGAALVAAQETASQQSGGVGAALVAAQANGTANNRAATRAAPTAPTFEAILKERKQILRAGVVGAVREPPQGAEVRNSGLSLDDLWIELDPFLPDTTPLDGLRGWFEAADGVRDAGVRLA